MSSSLYKKSRKRLSVHVKNKHLKGTLIVGGRCLSQLVCSATWPQSLHRRLGITLHNAPTHRRSLRILRHITSVIRNRKNWLTCPQRGCALGVATSKHFDSGFIQKNENFVTEEPRTAQSLIFYLILVTSENCRQVFYNYQFCCRFCKSRRLALLCLHEILCI